MTRSDSFECPFQCEVVRPVLDWIYSILRPFNVCSTSGLPKSITSIFGARNILTSKALSLMEDRARNESFGGHLSSSLKGLDDAVCGGIPFGALTELVGPSGIGKTQVDYGCTPEEIQQHFQSYGTVNRITILTDKFGQLKRFAYVEFVKIDALQNALLLNKSELHGHQLEVLA